VLSNKNNQGFTLIELMIALAVFTIGVVAALGLALSNHNNSRDNLDKIIAVNLAREGAELIKNVRDSNWLRAEANETSIGGVNCGGICPWYQGLTGYTEDYVYIDYEDVLPHAFGSMGSPAACGSGATHCRLYTNGSGFYNHDDSGIITNYSRGIKIENICLSTDAPASIDDPEEIIQAMDLSCSLSNDTLVGLKVTVSVEWEDNGTKDVEIVEQLYNWRR